MDEIVKKAKENYLASSKSEPKQRSFHEVFQEITKPLIDNGEPVKMGNVKAFISEALLPVAARREPRHG